MCNKISISSLYKQRGGRRTNNELLGRLYEFYSREIYLYLYSMCRDSGQAEDLMQECFLRAILSLSDEHGNMRAWLYIVARNLWIDELRCAKEGVPLDELSETASDGPEPLAQYLRTEKHRLLMEKLTTLEPRRREVLSLQYFSGLSQKEIAALLGLSHENVRVLSLRARRELKQKLEEDGYDFS